jgi:uncharacterized membrane protein
MKRLVRYFFQGVLYVAPVAITLLVCYKIFALINKPVQGLLEDHFRWTIPGLGFVMAVVLGLALVTFVGFLCSNIITGSLMSLIDRQFARFPLIKMLHSSLKDLIGAFVGDKKKFDKPVKVELVPGSNIGVIGFITREDMVDWGLPGQVAVYLPQSYNFAGNLIVIPKERIKPVDVPSGDVMAFVVSGGVTGQSSEAPKSASG